MNNNRRLKILICLYLLIISISCVKKQDQTEEVFYSMNYGFIIQSDEELKILKEQALAGDSDAAIRLAEHYGAISDGSNNGDKIMYWYRIGAEQGNMICQWSLGSILFAGKDKLDREEGLCWIKQAAKQGDPYAINALNRLEEEHSVKKLESTSKSREY